MFQRLLENATRFLRYTPNEQDRVLLDAAAGIIKPGDIVWDVGARDGLFSFAAAGLTGARGAVYAMEPDTSFVRLLQRSVSELAPDKALVVVLPCAVASINSIFHGISSAESWRDSQSAIAVSLDWLTTHVRPPNVLKIDTDGTEADILSGARMVLECHRPQIFCRVSQENSRAVSKILFQARYELFDASNLEEPVDSAPWNTLAVPI